MLNFTLILIVILVSGLAVPLIAAFRFSIIVNQNDLIHYNYKYKYKSIIL